MIYDIQLRFHPSELAFPCDKDGTSYTKHFPIYYRVYTYAYNGVKYKGVQYEVHYQYNYAIGMNDISPTSVALGYHADDVERIMILYDIETDVPKYVFLSAHAQEGRWFNLNEFKIDNGRLVVYVAVNSHRHCNTARINWRMFGFANDYTSDKGRHINVEKILDTSIAARIWNHEVMGTSFRAFFMPLYVGVLPKLKIKQLEHEDTVNANI